jgi:hypothetical protein
LGFTAAEPELRDGIATGAIVISEPAAEAIARLVEDYATRAMDERMATWHHNLTKEA